MTPGKCQVLFQNFSFFVPLANTTIYQKERQSKTDAPITIDLRWKARQPAVSFSALLPKLIEWEGIGLT
jgi:hypothetical protein